jgi:methyl-accepting chemotaxis protein
VAIFAAISPLFCLVASILFGSQTGAPSTGWCIAVAITPFLAIGLACFVARGFRSQITELRKVLDAGLDGNLNVRAAIKTRDELGGLANSLNNTFERQRDLLQQSVQRLTEEVSRIAAGDLTVEIAVADDSTRSIAESMNHMLSRIRQIVSHVKSATLQVSLSADEIQSSTKNLSQDNEAQVAQVLATSAAIEDMAASIQKVAENTQQSAEVAGKARQLASQGSQAVQNTIQGMERIRDQVQDTAKGIKRLGESSQQVGEIVQLISDISDRTSILALNASIQAAMAGEAGQGFAIVAEEVERLAERSNNATKQIATLIKAIQRDTSAAIAAMEENTREVVAGSSLAIQAGDSLAEIDSVANLLDELITNISQSTEQQARGADDLSRSMSAICDVTQQTAGGTRDAAMSVSNLSMLADRLRASVCTFTLPGDNRGRRGAHELGNPMPAEARSAAKTPPTYTPASAARHAGTDHDASAVGAAVAHADAQAAPVEQGAVV